MKEIEKKNYSRNFKKWIKAIEMWIKTVSWKLLFRWAWGYCKLVCHLDRPGWGQKGVKKERTVLDKTSGITGFQLDLMSEGCTKHTKHEHFVKHFLKINRKDEMF